MPDPERSGDSPPRCRTHLSRRSFRRYRHRGGLPTPASSASYKQTGMAGCDSIGQEWAAAFDQAVTLALQASARLVTTTTQSRDLITVGVYNHQPGGVEANHDTVPHPPKPTLTPVERCTVEPSMQPMAGCVAAQEDPHRRG